MKQITLYSGNGVSLSPQYADGRVVSNCIRLIADEGKGLTNGTVVTTCIDVLSVDAEKWSECEVPADDEEAEISDYKKALSDLGVPI